VLGWTGHENEQRDQEQVANRLGDIDTLYTTTDTAQTLLLLHRYNVHYIYIGDLERQTYAAQSSAGLDKFADMAQQGLLRLVYSQAGVAIYQVVF